MKHAVIVKHVHVLAQPLSIGEIRGECTESDEDGIFYFSAECGNVRHGGRQTNKWLHAAQIGRIAYDEDKGFFQDDIEYTHIAYYGNEFVPRMEDGYAPRPSHPLIKASGDSGGDEDPLQDLLAGENWGAGGETIVRARMFAAYDLMNFTGGEDDLYGYRDLVDEYPGFFDGGSILHDVATENGGEVLLDAKKLESCDMDTFVGFYFDYQIFDVPEELFNADGELDAERFFDEDVRRAEWDYPCRYCDKHEAAGYVVMSGVEFDEDDEDKDGA